MLATPRGGPFGIQGDAISGPMQEAGQRSLLAQLGRAAGQDEKCGLEGVFGVLWMPEYAAANGANHRPIAADEGGEGIFIAVRDERVQQQLIAVVGAALRLGEAAEVAKTGGQGGTAHDRGSEGEQVVTFL
jgi:hypothetical protein